MSQEDEIPYEDTLDFNAQRECLAQFGQTANFFMDWLRDILCQLRGEISPFGYAARVGLAQKALDRVNMDYPAAAQKVLTRVIRNLFPYDRLRTSAANGSLAKCLGIGKEIKNRAYKPLNDNEVNIPALVERRYNVLVKAVVNYGICLVKVLYMSLEEEAIPDYRNFADDIIQECREDMDKLKTFRNYYFFDFPEEEARSVSDYAETLHDKLRKRKEMPRDMDAAYIKQQILTLIQMVRMRLMGILNKGKEIKNLLLEQKARYDAQINELMTMITTLQNFISGESDWHSLKEEIEKFQKDLNETFRLDRYLPADVLSDLAQENLYYRNGYL